MQLLIMILIYQSNNTTHAITSRSHHEQYLLHTSPMIDTLKQTQFESFKSENVTVLEFLT